MAAWMIKSVTTRHDTVNNSHSHSHSLPIKLRATSMSRRTSGSAFSLIVRDAEVCWRNRLHIPMLICFRSDEMAFWMSDVIKWHPRHGAVMLIWCWNHLLLVVVVLLLVVVVVGTEDCDDILGVLWWQVASGKWQVASGKCCNEKMRGSRWTILYIRRNNKMRVSEAKVGLCESWELYSTW